MTQHQPNCRYIPAGGWHCRVCGAIRGKQRSGELWVNSVSLREAEKQWAAERSFPSNLWICMAKPRLLWHQPRRGMCSTTAYTAQLTTLEWLQVHLARHDTGFIEITGMLLSYFRSNPHCVCKCLSQNLTKGAWEVCAGSGYLQSILFIC